MSHLVHSRVRQVPVPYAVPRRGRSLLDAESVAVLHRAAQVLLDDVAGLTTALVADLGEREPAYRAAIDADAAAVWREVHQSLRHNIASLIRPVECREIARRTSRAIGATRAEHGVPLDAVLHAFRLGGAMVWQGLVDDTSRRHPEDMRLLVHVAADVWNFVDEHCALVSDSYRQTERRIAWRRENRLRLTAAAVLDGTVRVTDLPEAAALLGLPLDGRYVVVAAAPVGPHPPGPLLALPPDVRALWHATGDGQLGIVRLADESGSDAAQAGSGVPHRAGRLSVADGDMTPDHHLSSTGPEPTAAAAAVRAVETGGGPTDPAALAVLLRTATGVRAAVGPVVDGLAAVGESRVLAEVALRTCPREGGVVLLDEQLPDALVVTAPDLGRALEERVLGPLDGIDPADRDLLVETLTTWLAVQGSAQRAATRLYCHRNTVLNRLRRFEQLTGRSLSEPSDVVEISLALTARRLLAN
ncbi:Purine catabolism regulatory protein [Streptomyces sp. YIM 130001]|uniref:PucR family transcriptional regulator n=1 Tax=Streptomyces sp. YIM 130001 TaxID=2259644 RepID=UPI000E64A1E0|nr:helix-turn-helix domain-containing protein [Streptomyces sp. YIM 130001]RII20340.1 Purine catabolism regulatory protein [Streptomyces sp. YIM 130001]